MRTAATLRPAPDGPAQWWCGPVQLCGWPLPWPCPSVVVVVDVVAGVVAGAVCGVVVTFHCLTGAVGVVAVGVVTGLIEIGPLGTFGVVVVGIVETVTVWS